MARSFNGSSDVARNATAVVSGAPCSFSCLFNVTSTRIGDGHRLITVNASGTANNALSLFITNIATKIRLRCQQYVGSSGEVAGSTAIATGTWYQGGAAFAANNSRTLYLNGVSEGTNSTSLSGLSGLSATVLGRLEWSSNIQYFPGLIAEAGVWSVSLGTDEWAMLGAGVSPLLVRPQSLVAYWPLIGRASPEPDLRGGFNLTLTGTAQADHPRVYYPGRRRTVFVPGAGGGTVVSGYGTAAGVNLTTAESQARFATFGAAGGSNSGVGEGRSRHQSAGTAAGTASVVGVSAARVEAVGAAAGSNVSTGVGRIRKAGSGVAAGTNSATGASQARAALIGAAAGTNDTDAVSRALWEASGSADGTNTATGYIIDGNAPPTWMRNLQILKKGVS